MSRLGVVVLTEREGIVDMRGLGVDVIVEIVVMKIRGIKVTIGSLVDLPRGDIEVVRAGPLRLIGDYGKVIERKVGLPNLIGEGLRGMAMKVGLAIEMLMIEIGWYVSNVEEVVTWLGVVLILYVGTVMREVTFREIVEIGGLGTIVQWLGWVGRCEW